MFAENHTKRDAGREKLVWIIDAVIKAQAVVTEFTSLWFAAYKVDSGKFKRVSLQLLEKESKKKRETERENEIISHRLQLSIRHAQN